jgi:hypothetical protein
MDSENQWQPWLPSQRISASPSRHSSSQPVAQPEAGPSNWQEKGERFTLYIPSVSNADASEPGIRNDHWDPNGWQALPNNRDDRYTGMSSTATSRGKRRRRSSSLEEGAHHQGIPGETRGTRDYHLPPATRQRVAIELDDVSSFNCFFTGYGSKAAHGIQNWMNSASNSSRVDTTTMMGASSSLSPYGYHTAQGGHPHRGGEMGATPSGQWIGSPPRPTPYGYQDERRFGPGVQTGDTAMRHPPSPHIPPPINDLGSSAAWDYVPNQHSAGPPGWSSSQGWVGYEHYPVQERFMAMNRNVPRPFAGTRTQTFSPTPASELMGLHVS